MNALLNRFIVPSKLLDVYDAVRDGLRGNDALIFEAAAEVTAARNIFFELPSSPTEYDQKHREIRKRLGFASTLGGIELGVDLVSAIYDRVVAAGGATAMSASALLKVAGIEVQDGRRIGLTEGSRWAIVWPIRIETKTIKEEFPATIEIHSRRWGVVVPSYIVDYLDTAVRAYDAGRNIAAVALASIMVEATLRDVLVPKGYAFQVNASSADVYQYSRAVVEADVARNCYTLTFPQPMPKSPGDFPTSLAGNTTLNVEVKRKSSDNRFDLVVKTPPELLDHWSSATIERPAQKTVGGLGAALLIARDREGILKPEDLPPDFDEVIKAVRNNLIHLSSNVLSLHLEAYDTRSATRHFTLQDFLEADDLVWDLLTNVSVFVNEQYVKLRQNGHLAA